MQEQASRGKGIIQGGVISTAIFRTISRRQGFKAFAQIKNPDQVAEVVPFEIGIEPTVYLKGIEPGAPIRDTGLRIRSREVGRTTRTRPDVR